MLPAHHPSRPFIARTIARNAAVLLVALLGALTAAACDATFVPSPSGAPGAPGSPPSLTVVTPSGTQAGAAVAIGYTLTDADTASGLALIVEVSTDGGFAFAPASPGAGGDGTTGLTASAVGVAHVFAWNSLADLPGLSGSVVLRLTATDLTAGAGSDATAAFSVDNTAGNTPASASLVTPSAVTRGTLFLDYALTDPDADFATLAVEFSTDGGATWAPATAAPGGDGTTFLTSAPLPGAPHVYAWDAVADGVALTTPATQIRLRLTPDDGRPGALVATATADFSADNTPAPAPLRLALVPATVWFNAAGETRTVTAFATGIDGARTLATGATFSTGDPLVVTVGPSTGVLTAQGFGTTTVTVTLGTLTRDLTVTVSPQVLMSANAEYLLWDTQAATLSGSGIADSTNTTSATRFGAWAFFVEGNPFGAGNRLTRIDLAPDPAAFTTTVLDFDAGPAAGLAKNPKAFVVRSPSEAYLINGDQIDDPASPGTPVWAITRIDPTTMTVLGHVVLPDPAPGEAWSPEGACLFENRLFVTCTAFNPVTFGFDTPALFAIDVETNAVIDADPTTAGVIDPLPVANANPQRAIIGPRGRLYVIATGLLDFSAWPAVSVTTPASVEVYDPRTFEHLASIGLGPEATAGGQPVIDRRGRLYIPSGSNPRDSGSTPTANWGALFYTVDTTTLSVLRDSTRPLLIPNPAASGAAVFGTALDPETNTLLFANFNANVAYQIDLDDDDDLSVPFAGAIATLAPPGGATSLDWLIRREPRAPVPFATRVVSYNPPAPSGANDPALALGSPQGAGSASGSLDVVTIPAGGALVLVSDGARILDGPGADFALYENVFATGFGKPASLPDGAWRFMETASVAVSQDGRTWHRFPTTSDPTRSAFDVRRFGRGFVGVAPTYLTPANGIDPRSFAAGGDRFDLADLGLSWARYVRITGDGTGTADLDALALLAWGQD